MRSRLFVCIDCLMRRGVTHGETRMDTIDGALVCSQCRQKEVLAVDMVGRTAVIHGRQYVLCPVCCRIHAFHRGRDAWVSQCCQVILKNACE